MNLTMLGTSSMVPTKDRNHPACFIQCKGDGLLFDCGEGTQRQLALYGHKLTQVNKIFVTHWHGDHVLGIPGLLQSLSAIEQEKKIEIYGPKGTKKSMKHLLDAFPFDHDLRLTVEEIEEGVVCETKDYLVQALLLEHGVSCVGYRLQEKPTRKMNIKKLANLGLTGSPKIKQLQEGKTIKVKGKSIAPDEVSKQVEGKVFAYITDTLLCDAAVGLAAGADLLLCECTYENTLETKAETHHHLTASQAATIAAQAGAKKLLLTHFSARYKDTAKLEEQAQSEFSSVQAATDGLKVTI